MKAYHITLNRLKVYTTSWTSLQLELNLEVVGMKPQIKF